MEVVAEARSGRSIIVLGRPEIRELFRGFKAIVIDCDVQAYFSQHPPQQSGNLRSWEGLKTFLQLPSGHCRRKFPHKEISGIL